MISHPEKDWRSTVSKSSLSAQETAAYQLMQDTITREGICESSHALLEQELKVGDLDLTTPEGRNRRSKKNLEYLREIHHDCPDDVLLELTNTMLKKQCTLRHEIWDPNIKPETIIESGALLSNAELKRRNIQVSGGTDVGMKDDRGLFGNHDFVFTYPTFHDEDQSVRIRGNQNFFIPVDDRFLDQYAWLSLKDWVGMHNDDYLGNKQFSKDESKNDKRLKSIYYDFFVGKKDISQAVAYKVFEALKTVMILYGDEHEESGFDLLKAKDFFREHKSINHAKSYVGNENVLEQPIQYYTLSDKQKAFLLDSENPERNALISKAYERVLYILSETAELKVPVALSLDGASIGDQYLVTDDSKPNPRKYYRIKDGQKIDIPPESFNVTTISPNMPFERKLNGFECPD